MTRSASTIALAALLAACGSSGSTAGDASDAASSTPDAGALALTCASYCAAIATTCTGSNEQYSDTDDCLHSCAAFPVGTMGDNLVDTLGCRVHHLGMAISDDPKVHCVHAGPGGDSLCGDNCSGYCDIVMMYCTAANQAKIYDTRADCLADCATRERTVPYTAGDPGRTDMGNEVGCVLYHAQMASSAPVNHCLGDLAPALGGLPAAGTCRP
jgi:hypothetical protein